MCGAVWCHLQKAAPTSALQRATRDADTAELVPLATTSIRRIRDLDIVILEARVRGLVTVRARQPEDSVSTQQGAESALRYASQGWGRRASLSNTPVFQNAGVNRTTVDQHELQPPAVGDLDFLDGDKVPFESETIFPVVDTAATDSARSFHSSAFCIFYFNFCALKQNIWFGQQVLLVSRARTNGALQKVPSNQGGNLFYMSDSARPPSLPNLAPTSWSQALCLSR